MNGRREGGDEIVIYKAYTLIHPNTKTRPLYRFVAESIQINLEYTNLGSFNANFIVKLTK